jgi:hypothetical protein
VQGCENPSWVFYGPRDLLRIATSPPLSQPDSRRTAATITLGLNDELQLQGCPRASSRKRSMGTSPRSGQRAHDKSQTIKESGALHDHLDLPLTIADYVRSACPKAGRFPMTLATPLVEGSGHDVQHLPQQQHENERPPNPQPEPTPRRESGVRGVGSY